MFGLSFRTRQGRPAPASNRAPRPKTSRARRRGFLPAGVEALEGRALLAGVYTVNSLGDAGAGAGTAGDLRYCLTRADVDPGATVRLAVRGTINVVTALPNLNVNMTISGPGPGAVTVERAPTATALFSMFTVAGGASVNLSGLTVANGVATYGGGVVNFGTLSTSRVVLSNNGTKAVAGGGLYNVGTATLSSTLLAGNSTLNGLGGGVFNAGALTVTGGSTLSGNTTVNSAYAVGGRFGEGGAIFNNGTLTVTTNAIVTGNSSDDGGAVFNNAGATAVVTGGSTFIGNTANLRGGAVFNNGTLGVGGGATFSGNSGGFGGAVFNGGTLTADDAAFTGNSTGSAQSSGGRGGAVFSYGTASFSATTFGGNASTGDGGGLYNAGRLTVAGGCTFATNSAQVGGGGLFSYGTSTVTDGTFSENRAGYSGGGIDDVGALTLSRATLQYNVAGDPYTTPYGVGAGLASRGTLVMSDSTVWGNTARYSDNEGGGVDFGGTSAALINDTIAGNTAAAGAGLEVERYASAAPALRNTIVAADTATGAGSTPAGDVLGALDPSSDHNLIGNGAGMTGVKAGASGNLVGTTAAPINARLLAPAYNGGLTPTSALTPGSPAIDAGRNAVLSPPLSLTTDQRGKARAADGGIGSPVVDIGAFEVQDYYVTTLDDTNNPSDGQTSLREAVQSADADAWGRVSFAPGLSGTAVLTSPLPALTRPMNISGPGTDVITISPQSGMALQIFHSAGATVYLSGLTLSGGQAAAGGAFDNDHGALYASDVVFQNNGVTPGGVGGAVSSTGALTLAGCVFSGNAGTALDNEGVGSVATTTFQNNAATTGAAGGGAILNNGALTVSASAFLNNTAGPSARGGGIYNRSGNLTAVNSTFAGNAAGLGGAVDSGSSAKARLTNDTLTANAGGALVSEGGDVLIDNCLIADNGAAAGSDVQGVLDPASSYNMIGVGGGQGVTDGAQGNRVGTAARPISPGLNSPADNGGPTQTVALPTGSPAVGAGSVALAVDADGNPLTTDQRGQPRTLNGKVDVGAYQTQS